MGLSNLSSPVGFCKIGTVVLGFIVLCIGCSSHFQSKWVKKDPTCVGTKTRYCLYWYDNCKYFQTDSTCPDICMERFFVAMIIICFITSLAICIATYFSETKSGIFRTIDLGYYGESAILLLVAAILFITSAEQIDKVYAPHQFTEGFRRSEKLAAGCLGILQAILHGVTAILIMTGRGQYIISYQ